MGKNDARYVITPSEFYCAHTYLRQKFAMSSDWIEAIDAQIEFERGTHDATTLSQWCQRWLSREQWRQFKAAIWAARYRQRQHSSQRDPDIHVRLTRQAWWILSDLANRDGVTPSEFIVGQHNRAWLDHEPVDTPPPRGGQLTTTDHKK